MTGYDLISKENKTSRRNRNSRAECFHESKIKEQLNQTSGWNTSHYSFIKCCSYLSFLCKVADRLFSSFGQDILDALYWTATEPKERKRDSIGVIPHFIMAVFYVCILLVTKRQKMIRFSCLIDLSVLVIMLILLVLQLGCFQALNLCSV